MPQLRKQKLAHSDLQLAGPGFEIEAVRFGMRLLKEASSDKKTSQE